jgi:RNA polymerase sigma factor (TIGR02999 family)
MPEHTINRLLALHRAGDATALDAMMRLVYDELRRLAAWQMRSERSNHTLQPTALVHEAFLRLTDSAALEWESRAHFFAAAARVMRNVLVDHARARAADKRGGGQTRCTLDEAGLAASTPLAVDVVAVHEALGRLEALDPKLARIVEMRFFAGMTVPEIAEVVGSSRATIEREWATARAWLRTALG